VSTLELLPGDWFFVTVILVGAGLLLWALLTEDD
jgi:hypothetical protein